MTNSKKLGLVAAPLFLVAGAAQAAVPTEFTEAVTDALADVAVMAGALVGVAAVAVAFMLAIKFIKKITGAA